MDIKKVVDSFSSRTPSHYGALSDLGQLLQNKLSKVLANERLHISILYAPEGDRDAAQDLEKQFQKRYGQPLDPQLLSFYECFDGLEIKIVSFEAEAIAQTLNEQDWIKDTYNLTETCTSLTVSEWQEQYPDAFDDILSSKRAYPKERLSTPGDFYYGDGCDDLSFRTIIPDSYSLLSKRNLVETVDGTDLYYFDFFSGFNQIMLGVKDGNTQLYQAKYGYGDLTPITDDFQTYFKERLIRIA